MNMPKMKPNKGVKKRVKVTGTGKVIGHRSGRRHLMSTKNANKKRHLRRSLTVPKVLAETMKRMICAK
jgi:large subunit ribosomal protein L35